MAGTRISALTDGSTAAATDRIPVARSPFGTSDNYYVTPAYIRTYALGQSNAWTGTNTYAVAPTPATNDACALGSASLSWADVFLASGGVVNWNNGDVTITHSTGTLAFATGGSERVRIDSSGNIITGHTAALTVAGGGVTPVSQVHGTGTGASTFLSRSTNATGGPTIYIGKSRSGTIGTRTVVQSGDTLGSVNFQGDDGTNFVSGAAIRAEVDGTPGTTDMPGRLLFLTSPDGSATVSERMRIDSSGNVGIGMTPTNRLDVSASTYCAIGATSGSVQGRLAANSAASSVELRAVSNHPVTFFTNDTEKMRLTTGGELWIGYTSDNGAYLLQVNSQIFATSATVATSDARYKDNVADLTNATDIVMKLRPVAFDWRKHAVHNFDTERRQCGFLAQEVRAALGGVDWGASLIAENKQGDEEFLGLAETKLLPVVVKALQEAIKRIEVLEARLA